MWDRVPKVVYVMAQFTCSRKSFPPSSTLDNEIFAVYTLVATMYVFYAIFMYDILVYKPIDPREL